MQKSSYYNLNGRDNVNAISPRKTINDNSGKGFLLVFIFLVLGTLVGSFFSCYISYSTESTYIPLLFSGIPIPKNGFVSCFATLLFNSVIYLICLFLFSLTAFGKPAILFVILFRGFSVALGVEYFLFSEGLSGMGKYLIIYTPVSSVVSLILMLFAVRAMRFSKVFLTNGFSDNSGRDDFKRLMNVFLQFLIFLVISAFLGSVVCSFVAVFL